MLGIQNRGGVGLRTTVRVDLGGPLQVEETAVAEDALCDVCEVGVLRAEAGGVGRVGGTQDAVGGGHEV